MVSCLGRTSVRESGGDPGGPKRAGWLGFINQKSCDGDADAEADASSGSEDEDDGRAAGRERTLKMRSGQRLRRFLDTPSETGDLLGMSPYLELRSVAPCHAEGIPKDARCILGAGASCLAIQRKPTRRPTQR